jgi:cytochrome bd-type quinol oxidase subunit 1
VSLYLLALCAAVEAVVYLWRYRTAVSAGRWVSSLATAAIASTRVMFVAAGASAVMAREPWWLVGLAYVIPAAVMTACLPHPKGGRL